MLSEFQEFMKQPTNILLSFAILVLLVEKIFQHFDFYKKILDKHYEIKYDKIGHEKTNNEQIQDIACTSQLHTETLAKLNESIELLIKKMDTQECNRREDIIATGRATLFHLYEVFRDKKTLTVSEWEVFDKVADRYLSAGGNGPFKNKIIPEIRSKKVDDDFKDN